MKTCGIEHYGKELILDLHDCMNVHLMNRKHIRRFFDELCKILKMEKGTCHFWDYYGDPEGYENAPPHLKGKSAVQFIMTSNITLHTLDELKQVYLNIFSCKDFNKQKVVKFTKNYFSGKVMSDTILMRE